MAEKTGNKTETAKLTAAAILCDGARWLRETKPLTAALKGEFACYLEGVAERLQELEAELIRAQVRETGLQVRIAQLETAIRTATIIEAQS